MRDGRVLDCVISHSGCAMHVAAARMTSATAARAERQAQRVCGHAAGGRGLRLRAARGHGRVRSGQSGRSASRAPLPLASCCSRCGARSGRPRTLMGWRMLRRASCPRLATSRRQAAWSRAPGPHLCGGVAGAQLRRLRRSSKHMYHASTFVIARACGLAFTPGCDVPLEDAG
jgi:hypothetical protein